MCERLTIILVLLACASGTARAVTIATVPVDNPGNAPDTRYESPGYGAVGYYYRIGTYEVTASQYTGFLNAVAKTDTYGLYNTYMDTANDSYGCNIKRSGTPGSYTYSVAPDWANRPVNYVSFWDASRFSNWLNNGQPTGAQSASTTEDGSYTLNGYTSWDGRTIQRNAGARWVLPSEDEWYKAAYHKNDGVTGNYWDYPTGTNSKPSNVLRNPDPGNNANYYDFYGTGTGGETIGRPYARTEVGAFANSLSSYGTFDQGGNVWEWDEAISDSSIRVLRGGSFNDDYGYLLARRHIDRFPDEEYIAYGFRVAYIPEPATIVMLALAGVGMLRRRK